MAVLELYDMSGRLVSTPFQGTLNGSGSISLETADIPVGLYVLRLAQGGEMTSKLITVIR